MKYFSTNRQTNPVGFREATIAGQAPDKGLYFPANIPARGKTFFAGLQDKPKAETAFEVIRPYTGSSIPEDILFRICDETVGFEFPLVAISDRISALELFHGPTMAFKDVGARFMSRCLGYFSKDNDREVTLLVATSGDTGSAVASGFLGVEGVKVVILYPSGKVSRIQELQLTTMGHNITALEVQGTFDDCQRMVKDAFMDADCRRRRLLTSANSINVARWLPQQFYYFFALQQWKEEKPPVLCVPSGNFGNLAAGLLASQSGLPAGHFIAACNVNDVFNQYLLTSVYRPQQAVATLSNAMDVGDPSNFVRILELFGHSYEAVKNAVSSSRIDDETTAQTIRSVVSDYHYLPDTHGAVGYRALSDYLGTHPGEKGIFLETAHPVKFADAIEKITGKPVPIPDNLKGLLLKEKHSVPMLPHSGELKDYLLNT